MNLFHRSFLILMSTILSVSFSHATPNRLFTVLDNGLSVIVQENHNAPVVTIRVYCRAGSIYEQEFMGCGISHFFEHLADDGTTTRTREEISTLDELMGNASNAYTSLNTTCYWRTTTTEYFDKALALMADVAQNATFPEKEVEAQRGVIINEIRNQFDEPYRYLHNMFRQTMFQVHPIRHPIIGYIELFKETSRDDLVTYYQRMYVPQNMAVVIVGDVNADETLEKVKERFKDFERQPRAPITLPEEPEQMMPREKFEEWDTDICYLMMGYRGVPVNHEDAYALEMLAEILSDGDSSRLKRKLRDEQGLVHQIYAYNATTGFGLGYFVFSARLDPDKLEEVKQAINDEIMLVKKEAVTEAEIAKVIKLFQAGYYMYNKTTEQQSGHIGTAWIETGDPWFNDKYIDEIKKVTPADVQRVANQYLREAKLTTVGLLPRGSLTKAKQKTVEQVKPEIEKLVLNNGMTLLFRQNPTNPLVTLKAMFRGGLITETKENNGVSNFMMEMLKKGTKNRTAEEIARLIDDHGADLTLSGGSETLSVTLEVLAEDLPFGLDLMADLIQNPTFPQDKMENLRENLIARVKRKKDSWFQESYMFFKDKYFGDHPFGWEYEGTLDTIPTITREDLVHYHHTYLQPNNMVLAVFGDFDRDEGMNGINRAFKRFKAGDKPSIEIAIPSPLDEARLHYLETTKKNAVIHYTFPGTSAGHEDRYIMQVIDAIMSGVYYPGGRLHERLRSNKLVYMVHADARRFSKFGYFSAYAATDPKDMPTVQAYFKEEFERIKKEPVSAEELERGKSMCLTAAQMYSEQTDSQQANIRTYYEIIGLGYKFPDQYEEQIKAVTAQDIQRVAQKYFNNPMTVITGQEVEIAKESEVVN